MHRHKKKGEAGVQTNLQCTRHIVDEGQRVNVVSYQNTQTVVTCDPSKSDTEIFPDLTLCEQSEIEKDCVSIRKFCRVRHKLQFKLPNEEVDEESVVSERTEESLSNEFVFPQLPSDVDPALRSKKGSILKYKWSESERKNMFDEECQTKLMVFPHILKFSQRAIISSDASVQTSVTCSPKCSVSDIIPQLKACLVHDGIIAELSDPGDGRSNRSVLDIIKEIIDDIENSHKHMFDQNYVLPNLSNELAIIDSEIPLTTLKKKDSIQKATEERNLKKDELKLKNKDSSKKKEKQASASSVTSRKSEDSVKKDEIVNKSEKNEDTVTIQEREKLQLIAATNSKKNSKTEITTENQYLPIVVSSDRPEDKLTTNEIEIQKQDLSVASNSDKHEDIITKDEIEIQKQDLSVPSNSEKTEDPTTRNVITIENQINKDKVTKDEMEIQRQENIEKIPPEIEELLELFDNIPESPIDNEILEEILAQIEKVEELNANGSKVFNNVNLQEIEDMIEESRDITSREIIESIIKQLYIEKEENQEGEKDSEECKEEEKDNEEREDEKKDEKKDERKDEREDERKDEKKEEKKSEEKLNDEKALIKGIWPGLKIRLVINNPDIIESILKKGLELNILPGLENILIQPTNTCEQECQIEKPKMICDASCYEKHKKIKPNDPIYVIVGEKKPVCSALLDCHTQNLDDESNCQSQYSADSCQQVETLSCLAQKALKRNNRYIFTPEKMQGKVLTINNIPNQNMQAIISKSNEGFNIILNANKPKNTSATCAAFKVQDQINPKACFTQTETENEYPMYWNQQLNNTNQHPCCCNPHIHNATCQCGFENKNNFNLQTFQQSNGINQGYQSCGDRENIARNMRIQKDTICSQIENQLASAILQMPDNTFVNLRVMVDMKNFENNCPCLKKEPIKRYSPPLSNDSTIENSISFSYKESEITNTISNVERTPKTIDIQNPDKIDELPSDFSFDSESVATVQLISPQQSTFYSCPSARNSEFKGILPQLVGEKPKRISFTTAQPKVNNFNVKITKSKALQTEESKQNNDNQQQEQKQQQQQFNQYPYMIPQSGIPCCSINNCEYYRQKPQIQSCDLNEGQPLTIPQDRVITAVKTCEEQLKPFKQALFEIEQKLKHLNMPEVDNIFKRDIETIPEESVLQPNVSRVRIGLSPYSPMINGKMETRSIFGKTNSQKTPQTIRSVISPKCLDSAYHSLPDSSKCNKNSATTFAKPNNCQQKTKVAFSNCDEINKINSKFGKYFEDCTSSSSEATSHVSSEEFVCPSTHDKPKQTKGCARRMQKSKQDSSKSSCTKSTSNTNSNSSLYPFLEAMSALLLEHTIHSTQHTTRTCKRERRENTCNNNKSDKMKSKRHT